MSNIRTVISGEYQTTPRITLEDIKDYDEFLIREGFEQNSEQKGLWDFKGCTEKDTFQVTINTVPNSTNSKSITYNFESKIVNGKMCSTSYKTDDNFVRRYNDILLDIEEFTKRLETVYKDTEVLTKYIKKGIFGTTKTWLALETKGVAKMESSQRTKSIESTSETHSTKGSENISFINTAINGEYQTTPRITLEDIQDFDAFLRKEGFKEKKGKWSFKRKTKHDKIEVLIHTKLTASNDKKICYEFSGDRVWGMGKGSLYKTEEKFVRLYNDLLQDIEEYIKRIKTTDNSEEFPIKEHGIDPMNIVAFIGFSGLSIGVLIFTIIKLLN